MALARRRTTHFAESYVRCTVGKNLRSLLRHCQSADASVADAAISVVRNYAIDGLLFVQRPIAEAVLAWMKDAVESNILANLKQISRFAGTLDVLTRSLVKRERQKLVSLLVKVLVEPTVSKLQVINYLKTLWTVDDDPRRSYAEAEQQLRIAMQSASRDVRRQLSLLIH